MPKVQLQFKGNKHFFTCQPQQTTKQFIEAQIKRQWCLSFEQINLTYHDSDGDQISVDIQDDFDVAKDTMIGEKDNLVFVIHFNEGVQPKIADLQKEKKVISSEQINDVQIVPIENSIPETNQQITTAQQLKVTDIQPKQIVIEAKIQDQLVNKKQVKNKEVINLQKEAARALKKAEDQEKKRLAAQAREKAKVEAEIKKKQAEMKRKQQAEIKKKQAEIKKKQAQIAKKQAQQKKQLEKKQQAQKKLLQKKAKQAKQAKKQQSQQIKSSEQESKSVQKVKSKPKIVDKKQIKQKQSLTQERVKQLIRQQVFSMLPELKEKILQQKQQKQQIVNKGNNECQENSCSVCQSLLKVPFYFNPQNHSYICNICESKDTTKISFLKIRDQSHFQNSFLTFAGVVIKQDLKEVQPQTFEKFAQQAKIIAVTRVKQTLKKKTLAHKKLLALEKKKNQIVEQK